MYLEMTTTKTLSQLLRCTHIDHGIKRYGGGGYKTGRSQEFFLENLLIKKYSIKSGNNP